jgi:eukaryotic-like serine/threonine-protein kinase
MSLIGKTLNQRFYILKSLAQGGFGHTYLAEDRSFQARHRCVVKHLSPAKENLPYLDRIIELFDREAKILAKLSLYSNNLIPKLIDVFEEDGELYLVQEFIPGAPLSAELTAGTKFTQLATIELLIQILTPLNYCHAEGLVHRDLKPDNIMRRRQTGELVLIDFGIAKDMGAGSITRKSYGGTPGYAPEEQRYGLPEPASDVYAVGKIAIQALTGLDPIELRRNPQTMAWEWRKYCKVTDGFATVLDRMVELLAARRYQNAQEALAAIQSLPTGGNRILFIPTPNPPQLAPVLQPKPAKPTRQKSRFETAKLETIHTPNPPQPLPQPAPVPQQQLAQPQPQPTHARQQQPAKPTRQKFRFETAKLEIVTKTEIVTKKEIVTKQEVLGFNKKEIVTKQGFLGFNKQVEVEKQVAVEKPQAKITRIPGEAEYFTEDLGNGVKLEMVYIKAGSFMMGCNDYDREKPIHRVNLLPFYMGIYAITQQQYQAIMGTNPSHFKGDNRPVENVSWYDAMKFCQKISQRTKKTYTLPSESQWEYACRAGTTTPFCFGETITPDLANYDGNYTYGKALKGKYREHTTDVGSFPPNTFGLHDMHGNVWEWCLDKWHDNYNGAPAYGSSWLNNDNDYYLLRGGSWSYPPVNCRSASRNRNTRDSRRNYYGFRLIALPTSGYWLTNG